MNYKELEKSVLDLGRQLREYQDFDQEQAQSLSSIREVLRSILQSRCLRHISDIHSTNDDSNSCSQHSDTPIVKGDLHITVIFKVICYAFL